MASLKSFTIKTQRKNAKRKKSIIYNKNEKTQNPTHNYHVNYYNNLENENCKINPMKKLHTLKGICHLVAFPKYEKDDKKLKKETLHNSTT